ncbi:MAG: SLBB domain-containing protein [Cytophagales bacterium]|nr:SLBB domain-containing protein [Cytophagales bacterium]
MFTLVASISMAQTGPKKNVDDLTDDEIAMFLERAQSSGMTEAQIEKAAKAQGYTAADIAKMRGRISAVEDNDPYAKNNQNDENGLSPSKGTSNKSRTGAKNLSKKKSSTNQLLNNNSNSINNKYNMIYPVTGLPKKMDFLFDEDGNEKELPLTLDERKLLTYPLDIYNDSLVLEYNKLQMRISKFLDKKIFGADLFNNDNLTFEPDMRIATPKSYQLGPDDELDIHIFGDVLDNFKVKLSPEGTIKILNLGPIYINGLTVDEATVRIVSRLRQLYQGLNKPGSGSSAQVTLGNVRSIKVTLTGEVKLPGTYTVSSLATVFNALYLAGGPSNNGSYRNIRIIRGNKVVRTLDLYDFLLRADQKDNIHLQDQDIIRVTDYENRIEMSGEVKRPMIFESIKGETFKDVLRFAGGFTEKAYTYMINVRRNTSRELKLLNITQEEVGNFLPQNGDKYSVGAIIERYENKVEVQGAVFRPGMYALETGLTSIKELVKKAEGLREDAFMSRATLTRRKENFDPEVLSIDLGKILRGEIADINLQREDVLNVYSIVNLREKRFVNILGEVNEPGEFEFKDGMKVGDLILQAKGFKESASFSNLELARRIINHGNGDILTNKIEIITFDIDGSLKLNNEGSQMELKPFDIVSIRRAPNYEEQRSVKILGMVNYPGSYAIQNNKQKISDILMRAGGLRAEGYLEGAKLFRDSTTVGVNLKEILLNPESQENLQLMAGDQLTIPRLLQTIKLTGGVQNPLAVSYKEGYSLRDYIAEAGGYSQNADKKLTYITYSNGVSNQIKRFLIFKKYPKINPGAEIVIPEMPKNAKKGLTAAEAIGLASSLVSVSFAIITLVNNLPK